MPTESPANLPMNQDGAAVAEKTNFFLHITRKPLNQIFINMFETSNMTKFLTLATLVACASFSRGALVISEIDLVNNKVEIVNTATTGSINMAGYQWCNLWKGSPVYVAVAAAQIVTAQSSSTTLVLPAGGWLTFQLTGGFITDAQGELGLYLNNANFGSAANMVDYVSWGGDAVRDSVAATKGIWGSTTSVNVSGITGGQTIQLKTGFSGNAFTDYTLATSTIGFNQVPEPTVGLLAGLGLFALGRRRRN